MVVEALASRYGFGRARRRFQGHFRTGEIGGAPVALLRPATFVNESGRSVSAAAAWYRLGPEEVLVCCDDINLPLGRLRVRRGGSSGGHRGLASVIETLGTEAVPRLRVGIGPPLGGAARAQSVGAEQVSHVLGRFAPAEWSAVETAIDRARDAAAAWVTEGIEVCMNAFNEAPPAGPGASG